MTPGRDAVLRCEGEVPDVTFELLRVGEGEPSTRQWAAQPSADLVLTYVGPQHTGSYSCRYRSYWPNPFQSELSDPVELQVAGEASGGQGSSVQWAGLRLPGFAQTEPSSRSPLSLHLFPALTSLVGLGVWEGWRAADQATSFLRGSQ